LAALRACWFAPKAGLPQHGGAAIIDSINGADAAAPIPSLLSRRRHGAGSGSAPFCLSDQTDRETRHGPIQSP